MQLHQSPPKRLIALFPPTGFVVHPAVVAAARDLQDPASLLHRGSLAIQRLDAAVFLLYGFDRMPTDFFKMSITPPFSPSCLRMERSSASNSRMRCLSRL